MTLLRVTEADVIDHFDGEMIPVTDWDGSERTVPGWRCLHCGWRYGSIELPRAHECPVAEAAETLLAADGAGPPDGETTFGQPLYSALAALARELGEENHNATES